MVVNIHVKVDDAKLRNLIMQNQRIQHELIQKVVTVGEKNTKMGITTGRPEWAPLSERRVKEKGHHRILFDTGAMFRSIFSEARGTKGLYGTNNSYAPIHELGLLEDAVPRRAFLLPTTEGRERQEIENEVTKLARILYMRASQ